MKADDVTPPCLKCDACYDAEGDAKTVQVYYNTTTNTRIPRFDPNYSTNTDYETRTISPCPDYCFSESNQVKSADIKHLHQFAVRTDGYADVCPPLGVNESLTECQGRTVSTFSDLPKTPVFRIGGSVHRGFFVPPQTANYTFEGVFHGQVEVRLSDERRLERSEATAAYRPITITNKPFRARSSQLILGLDGSPATGQVILSAMAESSSSAPANRRLHQYPNTGYRKDDPDAGYSNPEAVTSSTMVLKANKPYYFQLTHASDEGYSMKLLSLTITNETTTFSTSYSLDAYGHGISGEFFREISFPNDTWTSSETPEDLDHYATQSHFDYVDIERPIASIDVKTNGLSHACYPSISGNNGTSEPTPTTSLTSSSACSFGYKWSSTPLITNIFPTTTSAGSEMTITGTGFSPISSTISIMAGPSACTPNFSNETHVICRFGLMATSGSFQLDLYQAREGKALYASAAPKFINLVLSIASVFPRKVSIHGGATVTITGSGFSSFGLQNRVTFSNTDLDKNITCSPIVLKNYECQLTSNDPGLECGPEFGFSQVSHYDQDIRKRGYSNWIDMSNASVIECELSLNKFNSSFDGDLPQASEPSTYLNTFDITNWTVTVDVVPAAQMDPVLMAEEFLIAMRSYECQKLARCPLYDEAGNYMFSRFGDWYDFSSGATESLANALTLTETQTPAVDYISVTKGMAGQVLDIRGSGFEPEFLPTDDNYYKNMWGFFDQRVVIEAFVGDRPCRKHFANDTFLNCTVFYDKPGQVKDVRIKSYGKGWSSTTEQYEFALDITDISPLSGSIGGGTIVTLTGDGFIPYQNVMGKVTSTEYNVYFGYDDFIHKGVLKERGTSRTPESWTNGWNRGYKCKVLEVFDESVTCEMPLMGPEGSEHYREEDGLGEPSVGKWKHANKTQFMDMEIIWNYQYPFNAKCALPSGENCTFSYTFDGTPVVSDDPVPSNITGGHTLQLDLMGWQLHNQNGTTRDFNWFGDEIDDDYSYSYSYSYSYGTENDYRGGVHPSDVTVYLGDTTDEAVRCSNVELFNLPTWKKLGAIEHDLGSNHPEAPLKVKHMGSLNCTIPLDAPVGKYQSVTVKVGNYGYAIKSHSKTIFVYHAVESLSRTEGSVNGGTQLVITGKGFSKKGLDRVDVAGIPCENAVVVSSTTITCQTTAIDYTLPYLQYAHNGTVNVVSNGFSSSQECGITNDQDCLFNYTFSKTPVLDPVVTPASGFYKKPEGGEKLTITGTNFHADTANVVINVGHETCDNIVRSESAGVNGTIVESYVCDTPKHAGGAYPVTVVTPDGFSVVKDYSPNPVFFFYEAAVQAIFPSSGSVYGGQVITISGYGFDGTEECGASDDIDVNIHLFDHLQNLKPLEEEIVTFCYKNYTTTYHNDTYFRVTCDSAGNSRFTEFADPNDKNHLCDEEHATFTQKFSNSFLGMLPFDSCEPVEDGAPMSTYMMATCSFGSPIVSMYSSSTCSGSPAKMENWDQCLLGAAFNEPWFNASGFNSTLWEISGSVPQVNATSAWYTTYNQALPPASVDLPDIYKLNHCEDDPVTYSVIEVEGTYVSSFFFTAYWRDRTYGTETVSDEDPTLKRDGEMFMGIYRNGSMVLPRESISVVPSNMERDSFTFTPVDSAIIANARKGDYIVLSYVAAYNCDFQAYDVSYSIEWGGGYPDYFKTGMYEIANCYNTIFDSAGDWVGAYASESYVDLNETTSPQSVQGSSEIDGDYKEYFELLSTLSPTAAPTAAPTASSSYSYSYSMSYSYSYSYSYSGGARRLDEDIYSWSYVPTLRRRLSEIKGNDEEEGRFVDFLGHLSSLLTLSPADAKAVNFLATDPTFIKSASAAETPAELYLDPQSAQGQRKLACTPRNTTHLMRGYADNTDFSFEIISSNFYEIKAKTSLRGAHSVDGFQAGILENPTVTIKDSTLPLVNMELGSYLSSSGIASRAFDGDEGTYWESSSSDSTTYPYIIWQSPDAIYASHYSMNVDSNYCAAEWELRASMDMQTWTTIDSHKELHSTDGYNYWHCSEYERDKVRQIPSPGVYRYFMWVFKAPIAKNAGEPKRYRARELKINPTSAKLVDGYRATPLPADNNLHKEQYLHANITGYSFLSASPYISSLSPDNGLPGDTVTISGQNFGSDTSLLTVTVGFNDCTVVSSTDTQIIVTTPENTAGVYNVHVDVSGVGYAGPASAQIFKYNLALLDVSPKIGSLGGGQAITVTGYGFNKEPLFNTISFKHTDPITGDVIFYPCEVTGGDIHPTHVSQSRLFCKSPASPSYNLTANATVSVHTRYEQGASVRVVAQGKQGQEYDRHTDNFGDYLPLVHSEQEWMTSISWVHPTTHVEHRLASTNDGCRTFRAYRYDPVAKSTAGSWSTCDLHDHDVDEFEEFIKDFTQDEILIFTSTFYGHVWTSDEYNGVLGNHLRKCGGSTLWDQIQNDPDDNKVSRTYILVGQCNTNYVGPNWSRVRNLEMASTDPKETLEVIFNPTDFFDIGVDLDFDAAEYKWDPASTMRLTGISRLNATTAGGTTVQINGTGAFGGAFPAEIEVYLSGIRCATNYSDIGTYRDQHLCEWDDVDCSNLGIKSFTLTCLTNRWNFAGDAWNQPVDLYWPGYGYAINEDSANIYWSYVDLWSSKTTWGGEDPPAAGDSVVITMGQYVVLDITPPPLHLVLVYGGMLDFADTEANGDVGLNCTYLFLNKHDPVPSLNFKGSPGYLRVGTEDKPFGIETGNKATITLLGDRQTLELPIYGAKVIAVRNSVLDLHGVPKKNFVKLAEPAYYGNSTIHVNAPVDWVAGDEITVGSTNWEMRETEELTVVSVSDDGLTISLSRGLYYDHWGGGWTSDDGTIHVAEYAAPVACLTRNVVVQGSDSSNKDQFGGQIVLTNSIGDTDNKILTESNRIIGRFSNVEVRRAGQGLKLGKYPIHFHMVGSVTWSYVKNCTVHHLFNRAIAIHGVNDLRVHGNVVHDTRGHAIFLEDGTEVRNEIVGNLVGLVRPAWSLLLVDQSPAAYWIVNPNNRIVDNIAAGSSHYGFWFRSLHHPDGQGGQHIKEAHVKMCPAYTPMLEFRGNVAHSTGRHGLKVSDFFPIECGSGCGICPDGSGSLTEHIPLVSTFEDFTAFKTKQLGIWGEFLVNVDFDGMRLLDHGIAGIEFAYINGKGTKFAHSSFRNLLLVGRSKSEEKVWLPELSDAITGGGRYAQCEMDPHLEKAGSITGCVHGLHLSGIGSEITYSDVTFMNYEAAVWGCSWCIENRGGYEQSFERIEYKNVDRVATWRHNQAGILIDIDGTLGGTNIPNSRIVPSAPHFASNPDCSPFTMTNLMRGEQIWYYICSKPVRRISFWPQFYSTWYNYKKFFVHPFLVVRDITDKEMGKSGYDALPTTVIPKGPHSCFEQAPNEGYSLLLSADRHYYFEFRDAYWKVVTGGIPAISGMNQKPDETILMSLGMNPPYENPLFRSWVKTTKYNFDGENAANKGWAPPPVLPSYAISSEYDPERCSSIEDYTDESKPECEPCAAGMDWMGGCDYTGNQPDFAPELMARPKVGDKNYLAKARGRTTEGGLISPWNGAPTFMGSYDSNTLSDCGTAAACAGKLNPSTYKRNCLVVDTLEYSFDTAKKGTVRMSECNSGRSWSRSGAEIDETTKSCGAWGADCLDRWRFDYDYLAINKETTERDDGFFGGESLEPELYSNGTITPVNQPWLCLTQERNTSFTPEVISNKTGAGVVLEECDNSPAQKWSFTGDGFIKNKGSGMCVQLTVNKDSRCRSSSSYSATFPTSSKHNVYYDKSLDTQVGIYMFPCDNKTFERQEEVEADYDYSGAECDRQLMLDDLTKWWTGFFEPQVINVTHGMYFYDMDDGYDWVNNILDFHESRSNYNSLDPTNVSAITFAYSGNTSLLMDADDCAEEGCPGPNLIGDGDPPNSFMWSYDPGWNITGDPSVDVPHEMADVLIMPAWTVYLDETTPILNSLEVRGTLTILPFNTIEITLNVFHMDLKGGNFFIGNVTQSYEGAKVTVSIHGDAYVHGKDCDKKPHFSSEKEFEELRGYFLGCGKRIDVNGELYVNGRNRVVSAIMGADAMAGTNQIVLDETTLPLRTYNETTVNADNTTTVQLKQTCDWKVGDEILLTPSDHSGHPESDFFITAISLDCTTITLNKNLEKDHIGRVTEQSFGVTLDMRSRVVMMTRNVRFEGGTHSLWDQISGISPYQTEYGATIYAWQPYAEPKLGWDKTMAGFEKYGQWKFPMGRINMKYVELSNFGKQFGMLKPRTFRAFTHINFMRQGTVEMVGIVDRVPHSGGGGIMHDNWQVATGGHSTNMDSCAVTFTDNILIGIGQDFSPRVGDHVVERNFFIGGNYCRKQCTSDFTTVISGGPHLPGAIVLRDNLWINGHVALKWQRACATEKRDVYERNFQIGAIIGFYLDGGQGCINVGQIHAYKNSIGFSTTINNPENIVVAENGIGVLSYYWANAAWPGNFNDAGTTETKHATMDETYDNVWTVGKNVHIIGKSKHWEESGFDVCSTPKWGASRGTFPALVGGLVCGFSGWTDHHYTGYQYTPRTTLGNAMIKGNVGEGHFKLDGATFEGFDGYNECGHKNAAIGNEIAGLGAGKHNAKGLNVLFGSWTCPPLVVENVKFADDTPDAGRLRLSHGFSGTAEGLSDSYARCQVYDVDGSIVGNVAPDKNNGKPYVLTSDSRNKWPTNMAKDCIDWENHPDKDTNPDVAGSCLWWIREYPELLAVARDEGRQGVPRNDASYQPMYSQLDGHCDPIFSTAGDADNNVVLCRNISYVTLLMKIPERVISGSEVLYGPVGLATQTIHGSGVTTFDGVERTNLQVYTEPDWIFQHSFQKAIEKPWPQPNNFVVPNRGSYRLEFTGDIGVFKDGYHHYQIKNQELAMEMFEEEPAIIISFRFMKAASINCYYGGRLQAAAFKASEIRLDAPYGHSYLHPLTRVFSFVVKGDKLTSLKILDIVAVDMGVNVDFATFFADNNLDPVIISEEFQSLVPPDYAANYNPNKVVKEDPFVSNMAAVLQINPERIKVTNIVPGNSRRRRRWLLKTAGLPHDDEAVDFYANDRRFLTSDEGLDLSFVISENDPCATVQCGENGQCVEGKCQCNDGWYTVGSYSYNTTDVPPVTIRVDASETCGMNETTWQKTFNNSDTGVSVSLAEAAEAAESSSGSESGDSDSGGYSESGSESGSSSNATSVTSSAVSFAELINVADTLSSSASSGSLDLGYEVTSMAVTLPEDVCGIPGGNGTTCDDACGVPVGDNSTCSDKCGIPHGDGTSCLVEVTTFPDCANGLEKHSVTFIRDASGPMGGLYTLTFNGETTSQIPVCASAEDISDALAQLSTIGEINVHALYGDNYTEYSSANCSISSSGPSVAHTVSFGIEFVASDQSTPRNLGDMPFMTVGTSVITNLDSGTVAVQSVCGGALPTGYTLEEQTVTLTADGGDLSAVSGSFTLSMDTTGLETYAKGSGTSSAISKDDATDVISSALTSIASTFTDEDDDLTFPANTMETFLVSESAGEKVWKIRFFALQGTDLLKVSLYGDFQIMTADVTNLIGASVSVAETTAGVAPASVMPFNQIELAAKEATAAAAAAAAAAEAVAAEQAANVIIIVQPTYVCGDAVRGTVEACDDGNTADGDGCSGSCEIESGYVCTTVVNQKSSCSIPVAPTLEFEVKVYGPITESETATVKVVRLGDNTTEVSVNFRTNDATAERFKVDNAGAAPNNVQRSGDYIANNGTLAFAAEEVEKTLQVQILADGNWDGVVQDQLAILLESPVGATLGGTSICYVKIEDIDSERTFEPTTSPTPSPTASPTMSPTPDHCTDGALNAGETAVDCGGSCHGCSVGEACNVNDDCALEWCFEGSCREPTNSPTQSPTPSPSQSPTTSPTPSPSQSPTTSPTPSPTSSPTFSPTSPGAQMTVAVEVKLVGITKTEFISLIPKFESDMAEYYGVEDGDVLVTEVTEVGARRMLSLAGRGLEATGVKVDYVVATDDRDAANEVAVKAETSDAVVKEKVQEAAVEVLAREITISVEVEVLAVQAQDVAEWEEIQTSAYSYTPPPADDGGVGGGIIGLIVACIIVLAGGVGMQFRKKPHKVYIDTKSEEEIAMKKQEEELREKKKLEEEMLRIEGGEMAEDRRRVAEEEERKRRLEEEEKKKAEFETALKMKPHYAHLGEAPTEGGMVGADLEAWLKKKQMDLEDDDDEEDDDEDDDALLEMLENMEDHPDKHFVVEDGGNLKYSPTRPRN